MVAGARRRDDRGADVLGKLHGETGNATRATLDMSSASQAKVHATDELTVDLSSGSTVGYTGHPHNVRKDLSSGSTLEEL